MLTQKRLREILTYDPVNGIFTFARGKRKGKIAGTAHDPRGFQKVQIDNERHLLHRLAWLWMTGRMPRWSVEHANGDRSDNRWKNLREGNRPQKTTRRALWREPTSTAGVCGLARKMSRAPIEEPRGRSMGNPEMGRLV